MEPIILTIFILGYFAITIEHSLKVDKLVPALLMALAWACVAIGIDDFENWFDSANHEMVKDLPTFNGWSPRFSSKMGWQKARSYIILENV